MKQAEAGMESTEVWLRGNPRPVAALAAVSLAGTLLLLGTWWAWSGEGWGYGLISVVAAGELAVVGLLGWSAVRPRLARVDLRLVMQLHPLHASVIPIDMVECFFLGSNGCDPQGRPSGEQPPTFRVGTVVMRLAERADHLKAGSSFRPWATWENGYVVFDGRWTEPISAAVIKRLNADLVATRREQNA